MKTSGSYASLLRGVSQQAPEVRVSGQHGEQVNLVPDPVSGLTRRRGTLLQQLQALTGSGHAAQAEGYRSTEHSAEGKEYLMLWRESNLDPAWVSSHLPPVICYNRTDRLFVPLAADSETQTTAALLAAQGVAAVCSLGRLVPFSLKGITAGITNTNKWNTPTRNRLVVWIRGGAYSRRYSIRTTSGYYWVYDTPDAAASGAAAAISPQNIAAQLAAAIGASSVGVSVEGAHLFIDIQQDASVSDGGDNSLIRGVYNVTDSVDKLPILAVNGQVVKIITGPDTSFYVEAVTKTTSAPWLNEARWIETGGVSQATAVTNFPVALIEGGTLRLGRSPGQVAGTNVPQFVASTAGDTVTNVAPYWMRGKQITYLGVFQDRLIVAAGAAISISAAGDYFNFLRSTMVTVPLKDGFEMIAQGGEDDTIRHGVTYSRNLVLFGDKRQYSISGTTALTPTSPNISIMTTYADAAEVGPLAAGGQIYYARNREGNVALHQIQPGTFVDSAESFPASAQIANYIPAPVAAVVGVPGAPSQVLLTSRAALQSVFSFSYLDQPDGRKQEAWSRWDFAAANGKLLGLQSTPDGVLLLWHRMTGKGSYLVADLLPMSADESDYPYFDSIRPWSQVVANTSEVNTSDTNFVGAFKRPSVRYLLGGTFAEVPGYLTQYPTESASMVAGIPFDSYVDPTNPYIRDGQGQAILSGRVTITAKKVNMRNSSGLQATLKHGTTTNEWTFNARVLGDLLNQIGKIPVTSSIVSVPIGRETREYSLRLAALKWYPFTLIGIEWVGQSFNRTPRA